LLEHFAGVDASIVPHYLFIVYSPWYILAHLLRLSINHALIAKYFASLLNNMLQSTATVNTFLNVLGLSDGNCFLSAGEFTGMGVLGLKVHWFPFTSIPQWSQMVVGTALIQFEGRSPTSSRLDESMPLPCW
jgi:hypothetical protein